MSVELINRIKKRFKHLSKWANRNSITCFRIYDRDLTNFPLIIDWYDGHAIVWVLKEIDTHSVQMSIAEALQVPLKNVMIKQRFSQSGLTTQHQKVETKSVIKSIIEEGLKFEINLTNYLDTGLFLDHRKSRKMIQQQSQSKRVLNLFAYTGSFTCHAIKGGALKTVSVDMNPNYTAWIKRNFDLNMITDLRRHSIITQDCFAYLKTTSEIFDIIICDPPTFSNSKRMEMSSFSIDRDYPVLLSLCIKHLAKDGFIFFSNNSRQFKMDDSLLPNILIKEITSHTISEDFKDQKSHRAWHITQGG